MTDAGSLDRLFDGDDVEPQPFEELTLGYDDLSDGRATALLKELPPETVKIIHRYTFDGPTQVIGHLGNILGLLDGLDERDPSRASESAVEIAREEINGSRTFLQAVADNDELPFIGKLHSPDDPSPEFARIGWRVVSTKEEKSDVFQYADFLDIMEAYLTDPAANSDQYEKASLAFMNDVIFRPGVITERT